MTTSSQIFKAAHAAARLADAAAAYRTRFVSALKSAWAAAKQTISKMLTYESAQVEDFTPSQVQIDAAAAWLTTGPDADSDFTRARKYTCEISRGEGKSLKFKTKTLAQMVASLNLLHHSHLLRADKACYLFSPFAFIRAKHYQGHWNAGSVVWANPLGL